MGGLGLGGCSFLSRVSSLVGAPSKLARLLEERGKGWSKGGRRWRRGGFGHTREEKRGPAKKKVVEEEREKCRV